MFYTLVMYSDVHIFCIKPKEKQMNTNKKLMLTAVMLGLLTSASAFSATINIDDFSVDQGPVVDKTANNGGVTSVLAGVRTITNDLLFSFPPVRSQVEVTEGYLDIANDALEDSQVTVSWSLAPGLFPLSNIVSSALFFELISTDLNPTTISFFLNGFNLANFNMLGRLSFETQEFSLNGSQLASLNGGGDLQMRINGDAGWDMTIDSIGISYDVGQTFAPVPSPGIVGLMAIGFAGLGFAKRRKQA